MLRLLETSDGGLERLVWMPRELKDELREKLEKRAVDIGDPDFVDKIGDETVATTAEELVAFLQKVDHPALKMPSIL